MGENEFAIVRPMMTCCAADAVLVGLLCTAEEGNADIKNDNWLIVKGKIKIDKDEPEIIPTIVVENVSKIQKPDNEFVYQY